MKNKTTAYVRRDEDSLAIGNRWVERGFTARAGEPFITSTFLNKISNRNYYRASGCEFCFSVDGNEIAGKDFVLEDVEAREVSNLRKESAIELKAHLRASTLAVELHLLVYADHPVNRKWLVIENRGDQMVHITDLGC